MITNSLPNRIFSEIKNLIEKENTLAENILEIDNLRQYPKGIHILNLFSTTIYTNGNISENLVKVRDTYTNLINTLLYTVDTEKNYGNLKSPFYLSILVECVQGLGSNDIKIHIFGSNKRGNENE